MNYNNIELNDMWWVLLIVLITAGGFIMVVGGLILKIKERYSYGYNTKKYLHGEYEELLQREYPGWEISANEKNIGKKELGLKCLSCAHNLNQRPLYPAGTLTKAFGICSVNVRIFVAVKPSYYQENEGSDDTYEDTEYYTWLIFDVKPIYQEKFKMSGSFCAGNFHPLPGAQDAINSSGQYMSDKEERKYDMTATVCEGVKLDNSVNLSCLGIRRDKWQNAMKSGLPDEINRLYSALRSKMRLDYSGEGLTLAVSIKMPDSEMYNGHNDFAIADSELIVYAADKLSAIARIIDEA